MQNRIDIESRPLLDKAASILRAYGAQDIYAFGSLTNGTFDSAHSDVDLAIRGMPPNNFYSAVGELLCKLGRDVDIIDLDGNSAFGKYLEEQGDLVNVI